MKKLTLLASMFAFAFALTSCHEEHHKDSDHKEKNKEMQQNHSASGQK